MRPLALTKPLARTFLRMAKTPAVPLAILAATLTATRINTIAQTQTQTLIPVGDEFMTEDDDGSGAKGLNVLSHGRQVANAVRNAIQSGQLVLTGTNSDDQGRAHDNGRPDDGSSNVLVNDPTLDNIQSFPGTRPFEESTQSETTVVVDGQNVVVGYNNSAGEPIVQIGSLLFAEHIFLSGFSTSHDGGRTWATGFLPPPTGSLETFGDPSLALDRHGNVYYANLAGDAQGHGVIAVNKSTNHGDSWGPGVIVATDDGSDKEWIAVGPNPSHMADDVVYVTWTSFQNDGSTILILGRSTDGGATWTTKPIFAPVADTINSNTATFTNPVVDKSNGRLYVPFLHFSNVDADNIRMLISDDAGATFHFATFNQPGAPDAFAFSIVQPGAFVDCGQNNGGFRLVLKQGANVGGGRFGLPRFVHATRLVTQPATAAFRNRVLIALNSSTSTSFGDPASGSKIIVLFSKDGGNKWASPVEVAPSTAADPQHVHPAISLEDEGHSAVVTYYVQQADTKLRTDIAHVEVDGNHVRVEDLDHLSDTPFDLPPTNIPFPIVGNPFFTTNYDRTIRACYSIGEYMSVQSSDDGVVAAWGDARRSWLSPPDSPAAGTHSQEDVFATPLRRGQRGTEDAQGQQGQGSQDQQDRKDR